MTSEQKERDAFIIYDELKPKTAGVYLWRVKHQYYDIFVQFKAEMRERLAGGEKVLSFAGDYWDGWRVTIPEGLQWREVLPDDGDLSVEGHTANKCPFCGEKAHIRAVGGFIGALPFQQPDLCINHCFASVRRTNWTEAFTAWNTRAHQAQPEGELVGNAKILAALKYLIYAKDYKEKYGVDAHYQKIKERAWRDAREAIALSVLPPQPRRPIRQLGQ